MLILTHAAAALLGFLACVALARLAAAYEARERRRPFRQNRVAFRQSDEQRLWRDVVRGLDALRQLDALRTARGKLTPSPTTLDPALADEVQAILDSQERQP